MAVHDHEQHLREQILTVVAEREIAKPSIAPRPRRPKDEKGAEKCGASTLRPRRSCSRAPRRGPQSQQPSDFRRPGARDARSPGPGTEAQARVAAASEKTAPNTSVKASRRSDEYRREADREGVAVPTSRDPEDATGRGEREPLVKRHDLLPDQLPRLLLCENGEDLYGRGRPRPFGRSESPRAANGATAGDGCSGDEGSVAGNSVLPESRGGSACRRSPASSARCVASGTGTASSPVTT